MTAPPLALPEGDPERRLVGGQRAAGAWDGVEQAIREAVVETAWADGASVFWPGAHPDELHVTLDERRGAWARVRVTVELLDGLP